MTATGWESAKAAAKRLGVDRELVEGLASSKHIRAIRSTTKTGQPYWSVWSEDIDALRSKMYPATQATL